MRKLLFVLTMAMMISCAGEPETFEELAKAGERSFIGGDYFKARGYLSGALELKPSDRQALYLLGLTYSRELMYDSAAFYLGRADILYPNDHEINIALYEAALNGGDFKAAREALRVLVVTGDPMGNHLEALAELSIQIEDISFAHYYYRQLLEREPDNPDRYVQVGNTAADLGSLSVAIEIVDSAIEKFGPNESFLANKGTYLAAQRKYPQAEQIFRSLLADDTTSAAHQLNLASVLAAQDTRAKRQEALKLFREVRATLGAHRLVDSTIQVLEAEFRESSD
ncbi:MAG: hypothetical protein KAW46_04835 [candidate division Zixibacteria bacterium]|nr:hypothetical protein [candidate division Zixibacteria bacterium]